MKLIFDRHLNRQSKQDTEPAFVLKFPKLVPSQLNTLVNHQFLLGPLSRHINSSRHYEGDCNIFF